MQVQKLAEGVAQNKIRRVLWESHSLGRARVVYWSKFYWFGWHGAWPPRSLNPEDQIILLMIVPLTRKTRSRVAIQQITPRFRTGKVSEEDVVILDTTEQRKTQFAQELVNKASEDKMMDILDAIPRERKRTEHAAHVRKGQQHPGPHGTRAHRPTLEYDEHILRLLLYNQQIHHAWSDSWAKKNQTEDNTKIKTWENISKDRTNKYGIFFFENSERKWGWICCES